MGKQIDLFCVKVKKGVGKKAAPQTGSWDAPEVIWRGQGRKGLTCLDKGTVFISVTL